MQYLETRIKSIIETPKRHPLACSGLFCASMLFRSGVALRHTLYNNGMLRSKKAPLPIVSIGNIVAGGTGKTPLVERLTRDIAMQRKVAILTRGYRGGDEAKLLHNRLQVPVYVGKNRYESAKRAFDDGCELALLDDGMQHLAIQRDLEIVVVHGDDPFGKGHFLPRGYLREVPEALARADFIVVNHATSDKQLEAIRRYSSAPLIGTQLVPESHDVAGKKVALFCGIGRPESFVKMVEGLGGQVVHRLFLPDHIAPTDDELNAFFKESLRAGAEQIVCTEKDWVKIQKPLESPIPVLCIGVTLSISFGEKEYKRLVERVVLL